MLTVIEPESNKDFQRIDAKEIRYKGRLYDVISERKQGNQAVFFCIHDKKEELLIAENSKRQHRRLTTTLRHNMITQALLSDESQVKSRPENEFVFPDTKFIFNPVYLKLSSPPPEIS